MELSRDIHFGDFQDVNPNLLILLGFYAAFCFENDLPCKVTSIRTDVVKNRVSITHMHGRAFDASLRGWPEKKIKEYITKVNGKFYDIAALSKRDKIPRAVVRHDAGRGDHFHHQCKP